MKKFLILITLFLITISKKCGQWEIFDKRTLKCECKYAQNIKTRKCEPPTHICPNGVYENGRCKPKKDKEKKETAIDDTISYRFCPPWKKTCKR